MLWPGARLPDPVVGLAPVVRHEGDDAVQILDVVAVEHPPVPLQQMR